MNKTKRICSIIFVLALAVSMAGCGTGAVRRAAREINGASALPMALLTPRAAANPNDYEDFIPNYTSFDYYGGEYILSFGGFPTDEDGYFLTEVTWTGDNFDLFGIKVGDDPAKAAEALEARGYATTGAGVIAEFEKDSVTVRLTGETAVEKISIHIPRAFTSGNLY